MTINDFIQGEKFMALADNVKTFYCHTHDVNSFFTNLPTQNPFVLISHNSDGHIAYNPTREDCANSELIPSNLTHWFGQNVNVKDPRISSLPIGLENSKWFTEIHKREKILSIVVTPKYMKNWLYVNHNVATNPEERLKPYKLFLGKEWATIDKGTNGTGFDTYLSNLYHHLFTICPEGNGIDTHRTWECLYLGTIPIEKRNINNQFYTDLPICFVDDWEEVSESFLEKEFLRIKGLVWNTEKLKFYYWKNLIQKYHV